jgi:hypothetical protein
MVSIIPNIQFRDMDKKYDILELQKLSTIELTSICDQYAIEIQNQFKQGLIYAILDRQVEMLHKPSESCSRDRYAVADMISIPRIKF